VSARIRLAAVQAGSRPGEVEANLEHAGALVEQAAAQGARLVALPELFSCGYVANRAVWDLAEPANSRTARWLACTARWLGIYLGASLAAARQSGDLQPSAVGVGRGTSERSRRWAE